MFLKIALRTLAPKKIQKAGKCIIPTYTITKKSHITYKNDNFLELSYRVDFKPKHGLRIFE